MPANDDALMFVFEFPETANDAFPSQLAFLISLNNCSWLHTSDLLRIQPKMFGFLSKPKFGKRIFRFERLACVFSRRAYSFEWNPGFAKGGNDGNLYQLHIRQFDTPLFVRKGPRLCTGFSVPSHDGLRRNIRILRRFPNLIIGEVEPSAPRLA